MNNYEIVQDLKEEEKQGRLFSSTKESSNNSISAYPAQNNTSNQNLDHKCFKNFFENAPIYEYMVSPEGTILEINKTALTNLGYNKEELIGKHLTVIYAPESHEKMKILLSKWKETGEIDNEEMVIATKQGEKRIVLLSASSVRGADGAILYSISVQKDVTEINKIYDELNKNLWLQNVKLQKLNETKKTFLKTTSHELRTPMTSIKGYVQMLMKKTLGEINEEQRQSLDVILRNTNRLDQVIQNILDASSLESGSMKFIPRKVNPRALVEEITKTMEPFANKKEMTINVNLEKDIPDLMVDGERIKQVLMNLVDNAIKYSPDGSMIHIKARKEKEDVLFEVQDFGQGIPKDKQGMIFESFYQADSGDDRKFGGAGLSLALSKGIVRLHGGNIWFESTEGTGSTFLFTLPIQPISDMENTDLNDEMLSENTSEESVGFAVNSVTMNTTVEDASGSITEYEKSTATPKENEERYRALFNSSFELIYLHDLKGNFIDANPTALKLLGYNKEDFGSLNFSSLLDSGQRWKAMKVLNEIKKHGRQKEPTEYRLKTKYGTFIDVETTAEIVYRDGKPYAIQGIAHNITEQKQSQQIVKESEEKYRRLFDSSPDLIIETDEKGNILAINPMMLKSIGVPSDKLIGKNIFDIFPREIAEERAKIARTALKEMKNQESEDKRAGRYFQNIYVPIIHPGGKKTIQLIARDTTDQKKAEEILQESEEKYRTLIENADDQIFLIDETLKVLSLNTSAARTFGKKPEEVVGESILDLFPKEIANGYSENLIKVFKTGEKYKFETKLITGEIKAWISANLTPVKDQYGKVVSVLGVARDITERKKIEEEVIESEEKLKRILDSSPDAITVTDLNGNIIECNQITSKIYGLPKAELIGKNALEFFSPKDREKAKDNLKKTLELGSIKNVEYTLLTKDGREYPAELSASLIRDASGNPQSFVAITRDITERKKAEEKIKIFSDAIASAFDCFMLTDVIGNITYANESAISTYGYTSEEFLKLNITELDSDPMVAKKVMQDIAVKERWSGEVITIRKNKEKFPAILSAFIIKDDKGNPTGTMGIIRDITERKKVEEELKKSKMRLDVATEASQIGVWELDLINDISIRNLIYDQIFGYNKKISDWGAKIFFEHIIPEDRPSVQAAFDRAMKTDKLYFECRIIWPNKIIHWITATGKVIPDRTGKPQKMLGTIIDITERKKAEEALKEKIEALERYKKVTVNRELKMIELKKEIKELNEKLKEVSVPGPEV